MSSGAGLKQSFTYAVRQCFYGTGSTQQIPPLRRSRLHVTAPVGMTILSCDWLCDLVVSRGCVTWAASVRYDRARQGECPHLKIDVGRAGDVGQPRAGAAALSGGQAVGEFTDHGIALAGGGFKAFTVKDVDVAALVFDEADALERACRHGHGSATRAEHLREKLLRDVKLIVLNAILEHEEPAREPLLHLVEAVAGDELAEDEGLRLNAVLNGLPQRLQALERVPDRQTTCAWRCRQPA